MDKKLLISLIASGSLLAGTAFAQPNTTGVPVTNQNSGRLVTIPAHAVEVSPDIFSLGTVRVDGREVEGLMIIDRRGEAKPPWAGGGGGKKGKAKCYAFLARGTKWKVQEPWLLNPANTQGLSDSFLFANTALNVQKWENEAASDIFGNGSLTSAPLEADEVSPDGLNEVYFGSIDSPGAIAVTIVWGIFGGPPSGRELIEWDQVYDEVDFPWSDNGAHGSMDYENISTHEVGHAFGMGHPEDTCTGETMYRFAGFGETKKRDLNAGDIAGIQELYKYQIES